jgi:hypothetical protein
MKTEIKGCILEVRAVEDCIRSTRKYTKGAFSRSAPHPQGPIQGGDFPSRLLTEYYEVYPDMELSWDMPASNAWAWVWGDTTHIDVRFIYDYRQDRAEVVIFGGPLAIAELSQGIPGFKEALDQIKIKAERAETNHADRAAAGQQEDPKSEQAVVVDHKSVGAG